MSQDNNVTRKDTAEKSGIRRRDLIKGLAALPVFGAFIYKFIEKRYLEKEKKQAILEELKDIATQTDSPKTSTIAAKPGNLIRLGIIGYGGRGESIVRSAGIAHPDWIEDRKKAAEKNKMDTGWHEWLKQGYLKGVTTTASRVDGRNSSVFWESERNIDFVYTFLKRKQTVEGNTDVELGKWIREFEKNKFEAALAFWYEIHKGVHESLKEF